MNKFEYIVEIEKDNNKILGSITKLKSGNIFKKNNTIHEIINLFSSKKLEQLLNIAIKDKSIFNPLTVLCDLRSLSSKDKDLKEDKNVINTSIKSENAFGIRFKMDKSEDGAYFLLVNYINNMIKNNNIVSIKEIEKIRLYFNLRLDYTIAYKKLTCLKVNKKNNIKYRYVPLNYYCRFDELDLKNIDKKPHKYIYNCYTIADVIFAVLHFLVLHGYNDIKKCENCEKYFFSTKVSREKYCEREKSNCKQVIKKLTKDIQDLNKAIYDKLFHDFTDYDVEEEESENTVWLDFKKERENYEPKGKKVNIKTLMKYKNFLEDYKKQL